MATVALPGISAIHDRNRGDATVGEFEADVIWVTSRNDIQYGDHNTEVLTL